MWRAGQKQEWSHISDQVQSPCSYLLTRWGKKRFATFRTLLSPRERIGNHTEQPSKREKKKKKRMWRIKLVRSTEKRMVDYFNGQFCSERWCMFSVIYLDYGLWQREYSVDKTPWWTGTNVKMKIQHWVSLIICWDRHGFARWAWTSANCSIQEKLLLPLPQLPDPPKPPKALCHTFSGQSLLFCMNGLSWDTPCQLTQGCGIDHPGPSLRFLHPKYAQLVTPPAPVPFHCLVFVVFSWFLVPKVQCMALNALVRDSLAAMLRWQSCREMNCTTPEQAQGGKLSELTSSSEPSCAERKCSVLALKSCCIIFFFLLVWLAMGVPPFLPAAAGQGSHCCCYFLRSKPTESSEIPWEGVGWGCGSPEQSFQWSVEKNAAGQPHNECHQPRELLRNRGSPGCWRWGHKQLRGFWCTAKI